MSNHSQFVVKDFRFKSGEHVEILHYPIVNSVVVRFSVAGHHHFLTEEEVETIFNEINNIRPQLELLSPAKPEGRDSARRAG